MGRGLRKVQERGGKRKALETGHLPKPNTNLFTNLLFTVSALDHTLDNRWVVTEILVQTSQSVQGHTETEEVDGFVEKDTVFLV